MTKPDTSYTHRSRGRNARRLSMPHAVGAASLIAAGGCACWLRFHGGMPAVSPIRALGLLMVCAYLVAATLLLLDDR
jgi:hypothetical protein